MLTLDTRIFKNDQLPWRIIENEAVLVDMKRENVIQLNEVAAFIWSQINGRRKVQEIIECVCQSFEVIQDKAREDTLEFLNTLLKERIIKLK